MFLRVCDTVLTNQRLSKSANATYLYDDAIEDEEEVGLVTHEHAYDVLVVRWVKLLMRRLRHCANQRIDEELEALDNHLFLKCAQFGFLLNPNYLSDLILLQVEVHLRLDELPCLDEALVDRGDHLEHQVQLMGAENERVAIFEGWLEEALNFGVNSSALIAAISIIPGGDLRLQINQLFQISGRWWAVPGRGRARVL